LITLSIRVDSFDATVTTAALEGSGLAGLNVVDEIGRHPIS